MMDTHWIQIPGKAGGCGGCGGWWWCLEEAAAAARPPPASPLSLLVSSPISCNRNNY